MKRASRIAPILLAAPLAAAPVGPPPEVDFVHREFEAPLYTQKIHVTFRDAAAAANADISLAPLYENRPRAVSCRWDDNSFNDLQVKPLLDDRGIKATWYLNSDDIFYLNGESFREAARMLLEGGHSIGCHALSHPYITYLNANRAFQEMAGLRVEWEAELDTHINSHAFSFIDFRNQHEGDLAQQRIIKTMDRSGIYHASVFKTFDDELKSDLILSIIMPPENQPLEQFKQAVDWAVGSEELRERFPLISHSMHAWYGTPAVQYGLDELEKRLDYLNQYDEFWQCNQNQYAAYRYQYQFGNLTKAAASGNTVTLSLERPWLIHLNDEIPLTLRIEGVGASELESVSLDDIELYVYQRDEDATPLVNLPHGESQFLPKRIGRIENPSNNNQVAAQNKDRDFPGIRGLLHWDGQPQLILENHSGRPLSDVTVTWRFPTSFEQGVIFREIEDIASDETTQLASPTVTMRDDAEARIGSAYLVAQLDFRFGEIPSRLYLTCNLPTVEDASFPSQYFSLLGPIHPQTYSKEALDKAIASEDLPLNQWTDINGVVSHAVSGRPNGKFDIQWLGPEIVPTQANWYELPSPYFILQTIIESPDDQPFSLVCHADDIRAAYINRTQIENQRGMLSKGMNHLTLVYFHEGMLTPGRHNAGFVRIAGTDSQERLTNIKFHLPKHPTVVAEGETQ